MERSCAWLLSFSFFLEGGGQAGVYPESRPKSKRKMQKSVLDTYSPSLTASSLHFQQKIQNTTHSHHAFHVFFSRCLDQLHLITFSAQPYIHPEPTQ
ncbi:hypothetical protein BDU57DRAFT_143041 [Ampelomyces quisqualis]|uniref:Secreted protein n=1 Tax=Ampelomyces quisqualis TaxID=50730 RepID=A0A6A5QXV6_AMPQU|nr:hypothetical protein BDU57DRAFT_143041 [Ampelomyces quisqualis]